jgi:hypothetical protein
MELPSIEIIQEELTGVPGRHLCHPEGLPEIP